MRDDGELRATLRRIDGKGYRAYRDIRGDYRLGAYSLYIDRVQGDPFAAPSLVRLRVPAGVAAIPPELHATRVRGVALADWLARRVAAAIGASERGRSGSGKSGLVSIDAGGQEVLERTAIRLGAGFVEARLELGLPAAGRRILGSEAEHLLLERLPAIADDALRWAALPHDEGERFVRTVENYHAIRGLLAGRGWLAFVADGAILPRESGVSQRPLRKGPRPFTSPESLRVELPLPHPLPDGSRSVTGMALPEGVTLIVGGGYHGKSTLLRALERGVYPHVPGDGRELVATRPDAVKIRAEDGRRVENVDISPFIGELPFGQPTDAFSTADASGSTSQAASIMEALEIGAGALLLDEDTSATNFMVRDARMQALVEKAHEPITPFLDRVRELADERGVSTVLVMGGSGDYFDVADQVLMMRDYRLEEVTERAREIAARYPTRRRNERGAGFPDYPARVPVAATFDASRGRRAAKISARGTRGLGFGQSEIDLAAVEQLVDASQTRAIGYAILQLAARWMEEGRTLPELLTRLDRWLDEGALEQLDPRAGGERHPGNLARPRPHEIAAAINRLRGARLLPSRPV